MVKYIPSMGKQDTQQMLPDGSAFGTYTIVRLLGSGATGEVYLAEEGVSRALHAIKVLRAEAWHDAEERFVREAEAAMAMRHPNLVEVYDAGRDPETGLCYLIMEYVPGGSLGERLSKGARASFDMVGRVASGISAALAQIESSGMVHRDVKPANILLSARGTPKLSDLGISRSVEPDTMEANMTRAEDVVGTPAYMAPEQMLDSRKVDIRADIYSLGVVLYEMLTSQRPNEGENAMTTLARALDGRRAPDVRALRPDTPPALAALVAAMIAPDPAARPASPRAVLAALNESYDAPAQAFEQLAWYEDRSVLYALVALVISLEALLVVLVTTFIRR